MKTTSSSLLAALLLVAAPFAAADDRQTAAARYEADKKLCAEESTSSLRMQCLRDARAEYDKALAATRTTSGTTATRSASTAICRDCGKVLSVAVVEKKGEGGPIGVIAGGVAGALLGNQIGGGTGKTVATVAGAAGGAYAGHKVEEHVRTTKVWAVKVRMDGGDERSFQFEQDPGYKAGDLVKLSGTSIVRR